MSRGSSLVPLLLIAVLLASPVLASVLPGDFILARVEETWKGSPGLSVEREVRRVGQEEATLEQVTYRPGKIRIQAGEAVRRYPDDETSDEYRPLVVDALFSQPAGGLAALAQRLGIRIDQVSLDRIPTPDAPLPFRVLYRLGAAARAGAPFLDIEKDRWYIRRIQFRTTPDGPWWRAEYDGQGLQKELPPWLPARIQIYRGGEPFERIAVVRKLSPPARDTQTTPKATPRKP